jgi:cbb3-type cytochrome oxidase subunit 3
MNQFFNMLTEYGYYLGLPLALLAIVAWVYRPSAKMRYQADGTIPFNEDKGTERKRQGRR